MAMWLAWAAVAVAAAPDLRIEKLVKQGKLEKALDECTALIAEHPFDTALFEVCADLHLDRVDDNADSLDSFVGQWGGTQAAHTAAERAARHRLDQAWDDPAAIQRVVEDYPDALVGEVARDRLWALAFEQAQGNPEALLAFIVDHPGAPQVVAAQDLRFQLIWNKAETTGTAAAWAELLLNHPQHPRRAEADQHRVDALFVETLEPRARLSLARAHPDHPSAASTLALVLPELVVLDVNDEVQRSSLAAVPIELPDGGVVSLRLGGEPVSTACPDLDPPVYEGGSLRYPFGACRLDAGVLDYQVVVTLEGTQAVRGLQVRQGSSDPTRTWAEHFMAAGTLRPACGASDPACPVARLRFDPDGELLVTTEGSQGIAVWNVREPTASVQRLSMAGKVFGVALGPGGSRLAVAMCGADESTVTLNALPSGRELGRTDFQCGRAVAWSLDGKTLATVDNGRSVALRQASDLAAVRHLEPGGRIQRVAFSPDGAWLAVVATDGLGGPATVHVVDVTNGQPALSLDPGAGPVRDLAFTGSGSSLQVVTERRLTAWDPVSGDPQFTTDLVGRIPTELVTERGPRGVQLALAPDHQLLAVGGPEGSVHLLQARTGGEVRALPGGAGPVWDVAISPGGDKVAWAHESGELLIWTVPGEAPALADQ